MSQELGRIERPTAESFAGTRKIFLVPLVFSPAEPPADYVGMLERYWAGVRNQIRRLAERTGPIRRIYHEGVYRSGEEGARMIRELSKRSHALLDEYLQGDAVVEALEDADLFAESVDWQRCLMAGLTSRKVLDTVLNAYREATRRRYETMARRIDETLKPGESAVLLIQEDHAIQFPKDIQVFYIAPPALDEIHRWLRDREERARSESTGQPIESPPTTPSSGSATA